MTDKVPMLAAVELDLENPGPIDTWTYVVAAYAYGAPHAAVAGRLRIGGPGGTQVLSLDCNGLGLPDETACRFLRVVLRGLWRDLDDFGGLTAEYITPDCTAWINRTMYHADASRVLRALLRSGKKPDGDFESILQVLQ